MARLKDLRRSKKLTQEEVSAVINMNQSNYSKMERGERYLSYPRCRKLALLYGVSMDYLCEITNNPKPYKRSRDDSCKLERLRELRVEKNLTQKKLQHITGIDQGDLSRIENGHDEMTLSQCKRLAKAFETSMDYIAGLTDVKSGYK